jgi:hypothetical protein
MQAPVSSQYSVFEGIITCLPGNVNMKEFKKTDTSTWKNYVNGKEKTSHF